MNMRSRVRVGVASAAALVLVLTVAGRAQDARPAEYVVQPLPPGGPPPRLPDGHIDMSGHWLPNGAGQGVSGRFGVDPAARGQFDPKSTPEARPSFQPWAIERM